MNNIPPCPQDTSARLPSMVPSSLIPPILSGGEENGSSQTAVHITSARCPTPVSPLLPPSSVPLPPNTNHSTSHFTRTVPITNYNPNLNKTNRWFETTNTSQPPCFTNFPFTANQPPRVNSPSFNSSEQSYPFPRRLPGHTEQSYRFVCDYFDAVQHFLQNDEAVARIIYRLVLHQGYHPHQLFGMFRVKWKNFLRTLSNVPPPGTNRRHPTQPAQNHHNIYQSNIRATMSKYVSRSFCTDTFVKNESTIVAPQSIDKCTLSELNHMPSTNTHSCINNNNNNNGHPYQQSNFHCMPSEQRVIIPAVPAQSIPSIPINHKINIAIPSSSNVTSVSTSVTNPEDSPHQDDIKAYQTFTQFREQCISTTIHQTVSVSTKAEPNSARVGSSRRILKNRPLPAGIRGTRSNNQTGYRGVRYSSSNNRFRATVTWNRKTYAAGTYDTPGKAAEHYDKKLITLSRESGKVKQIFHRLNFPNKYLHYLDGMTKREQ